MSIFGGSSGGSRDPEPEYRVIVQQLTRAEIADIIRGHVRIKTGTQTTLKGFDEAADEIIRKLTQRT